MMPAKTKKREESLLCPEFESAFRVLGSRWTALVLASLSEGPKRFCQVRKSINGISDRMLSLRLAELEEEGLVERGVDASFRPVKVVYELTPSARELTSSLYGLKDWATRWRPEPNPASTKSA